ncbi:hypothetical protein [Bordetella petrii]|uniref:hypothetical protein n=1 Tax=Bordetella petrii TaxID=94624 RepID=UPI0004B9C8A8|nr:hypothetical protein [Bordetella petrii]
MSFSSRRFSAPLRRAFCWAALAGAATLAGCANVPNTLPVTYSPSSVLSAEGAVEVGAFTYEPNKADDNAPAPKNDRYANAGLSSSQQASGGSPGSYRPARIEPNQIRNTAMGSILLEKDIKDLVRDATFAELRFMGVQVNGTAQPARLSGDIQEFLIDDLGYSVDWTLRIAYLVVDKASDKQVYQATKEIKRRTTKFANFFGALNDTIRLNIEELVKDPAFLAAIKQPQPAAKTQP